MLQARKAAGEDEGDDNPEGNDDPVHRALPHARFCADSPLPQIEICEQAITNKCLLLTERHKAWPRLSNEGPCLSHQEKPHKGLIMNYEMVRKWAELWVR